MNDTAGLEYIRARYDVPARIGMRVEYSYPTPHRNGTITGDYACHLMIKMDGDDISQPYHPCWMITYLEDEKND